MSHHPEINLGARLAPYKPPALTPRSAGTSAAGRIPRAVRPRALVAASAVEGAVPAASGNSRRAIPRRRHRLTRALWRPVDGLGAIVREVGLLLGGLLLVLAYVLGLGTAAIILGGVS